MARRLPVPAETVEQLLARTVPDMTWEEFAESAGVSSQTVRRLRDGAGRRPFRTTLAKLARVSHSTAEEWAAAVEASRVAAAKK